MTERVDEALYQRAKKIVVKREPIHSAYRSIRIAKQYKKMFADKYGKSKKPYKSDKSKSKLYVWLREKWSSSPTGKITGYKKKGDIYRPTVRVNKDTPLLWSELTKKEIQKAKKIKSKGKRITRFRK
jgi:hypothetical protein